MNAATDLIIIADPNSKIEFVNAAFEKVTGYTYDELVGQPTTIIRAGLEDETIYDEILDVISSGRSWHGEVTNRRKDGTLYVGDVTVTPILSKDGVIEHFIAIERDITDKKLHEQQLDHMAHHDSLTGLPNRLLFSDRLTQKLAEARRYQSNAAVMFFDLDRFKLINDTLGHNTGDLLLQAVAERMKDSLREVDTIARMGGDEFTVILTDLTSVQDAARVAQRILRSFTQPFTIDGKELFITTSIGISLYPTDGEDVETLVRNADTAMYRAKELGRNNYHLYTEALNTAILERLTLENALRKAIEREEFILHYQPRVDMRTGKIVGTEALLRWQHPDLGLVYPAQFIPLAEETGLIVPISEWVMKTACAQNKSWQDQGLCSVPVSVNISARQLQQEDIVPTVKSVLRGTGLEPKYLDLELTESTLMQNPDMAIVILRILKSMGVTLSIDDFGTGYSSLSYLKRFPIDAVKIDQTFIRDITISSDDAAIAGAVVAMAHSLGLNVIAEGVETLEQLEFLRELGCDELQGYFVSSPVDAEEFAVMMENETQTLSMLPAA